MSTPSVEQDVVKRRTPATSTHETHFVFADQPTYRGDARAACGRLVRRRDHDPEPTCATCRARLADFDAMGI